MSFSEQLFHPDNQTTGETRFEEMHPEMKGKPLQAVNGERVGDPSQEDTDDTGNQTAEGKRNLNNKIMPPEAMQAAIKRGKHELLAFVDQDPSQLAITERGPEAVKQAKLEVLRTWP